LVPTKHAIYGWQVGPRLTKDRERFPPNNILLLLAGAGLLWLGWAGFNGGDPYAANIDSSIAVINTNICAAMSLLVWTVLDVVFFGKPSVIGAVQGMITGLVVITPAAGIIKKDVTINSPQHFPILDARFSCRPLDDLLIVCWFKVLNLLLLAVIWEESLSHICLQYGGVTRVWQFLTFRTVPVPKNMELWVWFWSCSRNLTG
jgi:hypothetical protein